MSYADRILTQNCRGILDHGVWDTDYQVCPVQEDGVPAHTIKRFGVVNRYNLSGGFPVTTLRRTAFKSAVNELLQMQQKKSNNIHGLNSHIQDSWADENGSIDKAYGHQPGMKHRYKEGGFNQVDRILHDLKHNPLNRQIMSNVYNHHDLHEINLYPCAYSMAFDISGHTPNGMLNRHPQDMFTANNWNVCQYTALLRMFAQVGGLKAGELIHVTAGAHIYDQHIPMVEELLKREPYPGPTLAMGTSITGFHQFTTSSFRLKGYQYHTLESKISVAI